MKTRESTLRLLRFESEEKCRKVQDLELMIRDLEQVALDLERQITAEEDRSGIKDPVHYAYSTFAKAATQRKDNIVRSVGDLKDRLAKAVAERDEALEELQTSEAADLRDAGRRRGKVEPVSDASPEPAYSNH